MKTLERKQHRTKDLPKRLRSFSARSFFKFAVQEWVRRLRRTGTDKIKPVHVLQNNRFRRYKTVTPFKRHNVRNAPLNTFINQPKMCTKLKCIWALRIFLPGRFLSPLGTRLVAGRQWWRWRLTRIAGSRYPCWPGTGGWTCWTAGRRRAAIVGRPASRCTWTRRVALFRLLLLLHGARIALFSDSGVPRGHAAFVLKTDHHGPYSNTELRPHARSHSRHTPFVPFAEHTRRQRKRTHARTRLYTSTMLVGCLVQI